jgi:hypothetical protein
MPAKFSDVKTVLDNIVTTWNTGNGAPANLTGAHGASFGWGTKAQLLAATAKGQPLIQPAVIGVAGQGRTANIVVDLTTGLTVGANAYPRMPLGGLDSNNPTYLDPNGPEITTIVDWIEAGCPD